MRKTSTLCSRARGRASILSALVVLCLACSETTETQVPPGSGGDGDGDGQANDDGESSDDGASSDDGDPSNEDGDPTSEDGASDECGTTLKATFRDVTFEHPDFENAAFLADFAYPGLVETDLGADGKPVYAHPGATTQTTGPTEFAQWYNDTPGISQSFEQEIPLTNDGTGRYVFESLFFFPLDGLGFGDEGLDQNQQTRNFAFTTEIHTEFEYKGGEVFTFNGDDDLWLFINGKLAIDLGGLHPRLMQSVNLDAMAAQFGITPGNTYRMDIFHAERHTDASTFRIETTIDCLIPVIL